MINEFENRKIKNSVCEPVEVARLVASFRNVLKPCRVEDDVKFYEWLLSIGVSREDAKLAICFAYKMRDSKCELEANAIKFLYPKAVLKLLDE